MFLCHLCVCAACLCNFLSTCVKTGVALLLLVLNMGKRGKKHCYLLCPERISRCVSVRVCARVCLSTSA